MKNIQKILSVLLLALVFTSCTEENYSLGDLNAPSNFVIDTEIVGVDASNPNGDGSGVVNFTATATGAISYKYIYNGASSLEPAGLHTYTFGTTGTHSYTVTVIAYGVAGTTSSKTVQIDVFAAYTPPADLVTMLTGDSSKTWRIKSEGVGHFGVGPADAATSVWWSAAPLDKDGKGAYDDKFIFNVNGSFTHKTNGTAYGQATAMTKDLGGDKGIVANADKEFENYPLADYSESWSLSAPGGQETLSFSNIGYHGFYVGGDHKYAILSRTDNEMLLRTVGADGLGWFVKLVVD